MNRQEIIDKVCDRVMMVIYNELDYYMFEELNFTETNDGNPFHNLFIPNNSRLL